MVLPDNPWQTGMTLIEVLVAILILSGGLLGAATLQITALKHTDSALMSTQANFIVHDMLDRVRANPAADYSYRTWPRSAPSGAAGSVLAQDLSDFDRNIHQFGGEHARGTIDIRNRQVSITLEWDDARASNEPGSQRTLTLTSQAAADLGADAS